MNITGSMGLTIWDQLTDDFDSGQLADNFIAIDTHDHSPEKGVQIGTSGILNSAITQAKLANQAVGSINIQNYAVGNQQIAAGSITGDKIQPGSLTGSDLANGSIGFTQLDPSLFPMGYVAMWYRPPGSGATPGGVWEIMDGRSWSNINNTMGTGGTKLTTGAIPNMLNNFAMGTGLTSGVGIGNTGGTSTINLNHAHGVSISSLTIPPHSHGIYSDGAHAHTFLGFNLATRQNTIPTGRTLNLIGPNNSVIPVNSFSTFFNGFASAQGFADGQQIPLDASLNYTVPMDAAGTHNHTGNTTFSETLSTGGGSAESDAQLSSTQNITNPYVGLCFIMKVRNV